MFCMFAPFGAAAFLFLSNLILNSPVVSCVLKICIGAYCGIRYVFCELSPNCCIVGAYCARYCLPLNPIGLYALKLYFSNVSSQYWFCNRIKLFGRLVSVPSISDESTVFAGRRISSPGWFSCLFDGIGIASWGETSNGTSAGMYASCGPTCAPS